MICPIQIRKPEMLLAYAAGDLDPESARLLEAHLAGCSACREIAKDQATVWKALDGWEAPPVSPDFNRRLYGRIDQGLQLSWWERLTRPFRPMPLRQALPLTATAGLLLMAGLLLQHTRPLAPAAPSGEIVRADQVERTLDDLDLLHQFNGTAATAESAQPDAM
jgi:anti-sigma factor RsiW